MANFNLNVHIVPFFDSVKNPLEEIGESKSVWNNGYDNVAIELSGEGSATLVVQGCVNTINDKDEQLSDEDCSWSNLSTLNAKNYSQVEQIVDKGIYYVGITGISRIRVKATSVSGKVTIVGAFSK